MDAIFVVRAGVVRYNAVICTVDIYTSVIGGPSHCKPAYIHMIRSDLKDVIHTIRSLNNRLI
jgi:hypothetical protein